MCYVKQDSYVKAQSFICQGSVVQVRFSPLSAEYALVCLGPLRLADLVAMKELLVLICAYQELASLCVSGVGLARGGTSC